MINSLYERWGELREQQITYNIITRHWMTHLSASGRCVSDVSKYIYITDARIFNQLHPQTKKLHQKIPSPNFFYKKTSKNLKKQPIHPPKIHLTLNPKTLTKIWQHHRNLHPRISRKRHPTRHITTKKFEVVQFFRFFSRFLNLFSIFRGFSKFFEVQKNPKKFF